MARIIAYGSLLWVNTVVVLAVEAQDTPLSRRLCDKHRTWLSTRANLPSRDSPRKTGEPGTCVRV